MSKCDITEVTVILVVWLWQVIVNSAILPPIVNNWMTMRWIGELFLDDLENVLWQWMNFRWSYDDLGWMKND